MDRQIFNTSEIPWEMGHIGQSKTIIGDDISESACLRIFQLKPDESFEHHEHEFLQCMYFTSGEGEVSIDDRSVNIEPGLVIVVLPNQSHSVSNTGSDVMDVIVFESYKMAPQDSPFIDF